MPLLPFPSGVKLEPAPVRPPPTSPPPRCKPRPSSTLRRGAVCPRGVARLTSIWRLPSVSCRPAAASTDCSSAKVTKPKPRERPVSRSFMITASVTAPNPMKNWRNASSVTSAEMPPTKHLGPLSSCLSYECTYRLSGGGGGGSNGCGCGGLARGKPGSCTPIGGITSPIPPPPLLERARSPPLPR